MIVVGPEVEPYLDWLGLTDALAAGHRLPRAEVADSFLYRGKDTLLNRAAWIDGLGMAVKTATIFPGNPAKALPLINGVVVLYDDASGQAAAMVDFHLVTKWKTAGDSLLAARRLARKDACDITLVGAGAVARSMADAYRAAFPGARFTVWNRSVPAAEALAAELGGKAESDLQKAVAEADIIVTATMSTQPVLMGEWLRPGTHIDMIGAYRPDMREGDDDCLRRARVFVDSRATTLHHIGELKDPLARGIITEADVVADYYDDPALFSRRSDDEITLCKNGGGAHLDLMTARYILDAARGAGLA